MRHDARMLGGTTGTVDNLVAPVQNLRTSNPPIDILGALYTFTIQLDISSAHILLKQAIC